MRSMWFMISGAQASPMEPLHLSSPSRSVASRLAARAIAKTPASVCGWASSFLPRYAHNQRVERLTKYGPPNVMTGAPEISTRPGYTWTKKLRVVCAVCNSTWMSRIESAAQPILTPLIQSLPTTITVTQIIALSRWIALKIMVGEQNKPSDAVISSEDRKIFKESLQIPQNMWIWLARCGRDGWECAYWRHSATLSVNTLFKADYRYSNAHAVTFGIGDLLVHVFHTIIRTWARSMTSSIKAQF
jgi:hypothetical protein